MPGGQNCPGMLSRTKQWNQVAQWPVHSLDFHPELLVLCTQYQLVRVSLGQHSCGVVLTTFWVHALINWDRSEVGLRGKTVLEKCHSCSVLNRVQQQGAKREGEELTCNKARVVNSNVQHCKAVFSFLRLMKTSGAVRGAEHVLLNQRLCTVPLTPLIYIKLHSKDSVVLHGIITTPILKLNDIYFKYKYILV